MWDSILDLVHHFSTLTLMTGQPKSMVFFLFCAGFTHTYLTSLNYLLVMWYAWLFVLTSVPDFLFQLLYSGLLCGFTR